MANRNLQVLVNFVDGSGNHLKHFGSNIPFVLNAAMVPESGGTPGGRPDSVAIKNILQANGEIPAGANVQIVSVKNLDKEHAPAGILT